MSWRSESGWFFTEKAQRESGVRETATFRKKYFFPEIQERKYIIVNTRKHISAEKIKTTIIPNS